MAKLKCRFCGSEQVTALKGNLGRCSSCGGWQTVPVDPEDTQKQSLFAQAQELWLQGQFEAAGQAYAALAQEYPQEAEGSWGQLLCQYGVGYVKDPESLQYSPICRRLSYDPVAENPLCKRAVELAGQEVGAYYTSVANEIDEIRKKMIEIAQRQDASDVYVCCLCNGQGEENEIDKEYIEQLCRDLSELGLNVYCDEHREAGKDYENISSSFAALNSAKVMVVLATQPDQCEQEPMKYEWKHFDNLKGDRSLIPCFRHIKPEDMPGDLRRKQALNLCQYGANQDLVSWIRTALDLDLLAQQKQKQSEVEIALNKAALELASRDFETAAESYEKILEQNLECGRAYLGKFLAEEGAVDLKDLIDVRLHATNRAQEHVLRIQSDGDHIDEMVQQYEIPYELTDGDIRKSYAFGEVRTSTLTGREDQLKQEKLRFQKNPLLKRALQYTDEGQQKKIREALEALYGAMAQRITEARSQEQRDRDALLSSYADFCERADREVERRYEEIKIRQRIELQRQAQEDKKHRARVIRNVVIVLALLAAAAAGLLALRLRSRKQLEQKYETAQQLMDSGSYAQAAELYEELEEPEALKKCDYALAQEKEAEGKIQEAAMLYGSADHYKDSFRKSMALWDSFLVRDTCALASGTFVGIKTDGSTVTGGDNGENECELDQYRDFIEVDAGYKFSCGLRADGTVQAVGNEKLVQEISQWKDIVTIESGGDFLVGLRTDGTLALAGSVKQLGKEPLTWTGLTGIAAGSSHVVGLYPDGTMVVAGDTAFYEEVDEPWEDIAAVRPLGSRNFGVLRDGTLVVDSEGLTYRREMLEWTDMADVRGDWNYAVGLKKDGTLVLAGDLRCEDQSFLNWTDVQSIQLLGNEYLVAFQTDGTMLAAALNDYSSLDTFPLKDIMAPAVKPLPESPAEETQNG